MLDSIIYSIFNDVKYGIIILDTEFNIIYLNDTAEILSHIYRDEVIGKKISDVYPSLSKVSGVLYKAMKNRQPYKDTIEEYTNYYGEKLATVNSAYPLFDNNIFKGVLLTFMHYSQLKNFNKNSKKIKAEDNSDKSLYSFTDIISKNDDMLKIKDRAYRAALTDLPVLIYGETGTGKELFVQAIQHSSERKNKPFIAQNCAAIPSNLLEGILFGTVKGSFTGSENRQGLFEIAEGGTLYLDELNSMPIELQPKLLRVLQEGTIRRVGDINEKKVDVRIIASVNEQPVKILNQGKIRKDLYYRLNVIRLDIPPLRDRLEDIPLLVEYFTNKYNLIFKSRVKGIEKDVLKKFYLYDWPGNVRELEHIIEYAFNNKTEGYICFRDIEGHFNNFSFREEIGRGTLSEKLRICEEKYIKEAMLLSGNNVSKAARILGIPRQTLQYKLEKLNLKK